MNTRTFDKDALLDLITDAQEYLNTAIERIEEYVRRSGDQAAEAYILDHLKIMAGSNHGFLAGDLNLNDIIEQLNQFEAEENDEDDNPPDVKVVGERTLYLLRNNLGPIRNRFGDPIYATIPQD